MQRTVLAALCLCACLNATAAFAHFGMIIPTRSSVSFLREEAIHLELKFWHPFANTGMHLEEPASFRVHHNGKTVDLLDSLRLGGEQGKKIWRSSFQIEKPGLYAFVMEPQPYFEEAEDRFILHLTKVYVDAYGDDEGWDEPLGLQTEIVPLVRPGALYAGNLFQGRVLRDGKPVPGALVEVEWYCGEGKDGVAPHPGMVTQTVRADGAGVFSFAAPRNGWWGFAALQEGGTLKKEGVEKELELGAVLWVFFHPLLPAKDMGAL